ncbi:MAG: polyprenyl synthetase family protein [Hyphomicrobiaceae bacterium]
MSTQFETQLMAARVDVEAALGAYLGPVALGGRVPARLRAAMQHAVLGGGKRFRPFLVLESARLFGASQRAAMAVAAALECIHCYSLAHDDLPAMDNDVLRRGQPTVWAAFDEWTAILAGDSLLTLAFEIIAAPSADIPAEVLGPLTVALARAAGADGMVGGQVYDLAADRLREPKSASLEHVRQLQAMKTGALIRFACVAGPMLARSSVDDVARMQRYGDALGFAFQISDDLLDVTGDVAAVGKAVAKDAVQGKATLVSLHGVEGARRVLQETQASAVDALSIYGERARTLIDAVEFVGSRQS